MSKTIDFYFDIISPYSYLAHKKIKKLSQKNKIQFSYKPILLGGLHKLAEITAPAFNKFKLKNMKTDCDLIAKKNNIDFKWNKKFPINSLYIMRGYLFTDNKMKAEYLDVFFNAYWRDNIDLSIENNIKDILNKCNINKKKFFNSIKQEKIKNKLISLTNDAFKKEVFGAPTFIINNKIFWGQDRLDYAIEEYNS